MTLSRQFYDPGEGAAKRRRLARAWAPQGHRAPFSGPTYRRGAAPAAFCSLVWQPRRAARRREESRGCPSALVCAAPRAWLPLRAWLFPLGRELAFCFVVRCVYVAKSSRRAAAARQQPKGLSLDSPAPPPRPSERREDSTARPRYDKRQRVQPATAAAHTT